MESCNRLVKLGRRQFLRGGATTAAATVAAGIIPQRADATPALARITYRAPSWLTSKTLKSMPRCRSNTPTRIRPG